MFAAVFNFGPSSTARKLVVTISLLALAKLPASVAVNPVRNARDLFYETLGPLGLRYAILKLGPDKRFYEVSPKTVFHVNDEIRVRLTSNQEGYLYVVHRGSGGGWFILFPKPVPQASENLIRAKEPYEVPQDPYEDFIMDNQRGEERFFLMLARQPVTDLDEIINSLRRHARLATNQRGSKANDFSVPEAIINDLLKQGTSRDLVEETIEQTGEENAVYIVDAPHSGQTDDRIVVAFTLTHR